MSKHEDEVCKKIQQRAGSAKRNTEPRWKEQTFRFTNGLFIYKKN